LVRVATRPPPSTSAQSLSDLRRAIARVIRGKDDAIRLSIVAMLARGHLLVEDIPGVGKSTLACALARAVGGTFNRIQFTSDLLPGDLLGINVWLPQKERFEFRMGPLFANVVLADEVNRAPPRTQSALLEAMGEHQISIDGTRHELPRPFTVLATQNPEEHHGTYPLPESQRDRFLFRIALGYASPEVETALLLGSGEDGERVDPDAIEPVLEPTQLLELQDAAARIHLHPDLGAYAQRVVQATREANDLRLGVSTRGALAWVAAARAHALFDGRDSVTIDDLQDLAVPALAHRVIPTRSASSEQGRVADELIRDIVASVPVPL
jgi:MoxR-like ATPase